MAAKEKRIITVFDANKIFDDKVKKLDPKHQVIKQRTSNLNFDFAISCKGDEEEKMLRADIERRCGTAQKKLETDIENTIDSWWKNYVSIQGKVATVVNTSDINSALAILGKDIASLLKAQADDTGKEIEKTLRSRKRGKLHKASMAVKSVRLVANPILRIAGSAVAAILTAPTVILPILIITKAIGGVGKDIKSAAVFFDGERRSTKLLQDEIDRLGKKLQTEYDAVINEADAKEREDKNRSRGNREVWAKVHTDFLGSEKDSIKRLEYYLEKYKQKIDLHRARMFKHAKLLDKLAKKSEKLVSEKKTAEGKLAAQNNFNIMKSDQKIKKLNKTIEEITSKKRELGDAITISTKSMADYSARLDKEENTIKESKNKVLEFKTSLPDDVKRAKRLLNGLGGIFSTADAVIDVSAGQFGPDLTGALPALDQLTMYSGILEAVADEAASQFGDKAGSRIARR